MKRFFLILLLFICSLGIIYSQVIIDDNNIEEKYNIEIGRPINDNFKSMNDENSYIDYNDFSLGLGLEEELSVYNNGKIIDNAYVTWTSSNEDIITVNEYGKIYAKSLGSTSIIAELPNGCKDVINVKAVTIPVTSVKLSKTSLSLYKGYSTTLKATVSPSNATYKTVTWKSSNTKVATVSSSGVVKGVSLGSVTITATTKGKNKSGKQLTATCKVTVVAIPVTSVKLNKTSLSIAKGNSATLTATVSPSNATYKTVTWKSSNTKIATVSTSGVVKAIAKGSANITATTSGKNKSGKQLTSTCKVTVVEIPVTSVKLNKTSLTLGKNNSTTLKATVSPSNATYKTVTWKSSNKKVATVSSSGVVTGIALGEATITVTTNGKDKSGKQLTSTCKVTVVEIPVTSVKLDKTSLSVANGYTSTLIATVSPSNASYKTVTWQSSNTKVATVSSSGVVKGIGLGSAIITVTTNGKNKSGKQVSTTCNVTVTNPIYVTKIKLNKSSISLVKGYSATLTATVSPTNATDKNVTWKSSNTKVATVSTSGEIKGIGAGSATITATTKGKDKNGKQLSTTCKVTVTNPISVTSVKLNYTSLNVAKDYSATLKATVSPSNATVKTVTWTSSNTKIATVSENGVVAGISVGDATITATTVGKNSSGKQLTATCKVTVTNDASAKITITEPTKKYGDAYLLKYSNDDHIIQVKTTLSNSIKEEKLSYEWHLDTTTGYKLKNTDSIYDTAEFIYRPKNTSVIPKDVTTGVNRVYNRGFKVNFVYNKTIIGRYIYLLVKNSNGKTLGSFKFYVDKPDTPPEPSR